MAFVVAPRAPWHHGDRRQPQGAVWETQRASAFADAFGRPFTEQDAGGDGVLGHAGGNVTPRHDTRSVRGTLRDAVDAIDRGVTDGEIITPRGV